MDFSGVALDQHLGHGTGYPEISVHLKRGMRTEEVGEGVVGEQATYHDTGPLALAQTSPEGTSPWPGPRPAAVANGRLNGEGGFGIFPVVATPAAKRENGCFGQFRGFCHTDLTSGIDGKEVRSVTVLIVGIVTVGLPLL